MVFRAWILAVCLGGIACIFICRLFWLQVIEGERFGRSIESDRHVETLIPARRGRIIDRHGEVLIDNKTVYHLALVLKDLTYARRQTRRHPFRVIDTTALTQISADLALRCGLPHPDVHQCVVQELERHPGVALRRGRPRSVHTPQLIAIPQSALEFEQLNEADRPNVARLLEKRMLDISIPRALLSELSDHNDNHYRIIDDREWQRIGALLDTHFHMNRPFCAETLAPFAQTLRLSVENPDEDSPHVNGFVWRLLSTSELEQGIAHISAYINNDTYSTQQIHSVITQHIHRARTPHSDIPFYFAPLSQAAHIYALLPAHSQHYTIDIRGLPPSRERIYIMQGDGADQPEDGLATLFYNRLQASLGITVDWLPQLFELHSKRISASYSERKYHKKQVALDPEKMKLFTQRIAATLIHADIPCDIIQAEQFITDIRRLSDREWRGFSRNSPIPFYKDIPRRLALALSGAGFSVPKKLARNYDGGYDGGMAAIPGLRILTSNGRESLTPGSASHSMGYLGRLDSTMTRQEALSWGLDPNGLRGRNGIEARYDQYLQGSTGKKVSLLNEHGDYSELTAESIAPVPGDDLRCTIDAQLQHSVEYALKNWQTLARELGTSTSKMVASSESGKNRSGMIVMDVHSGAVLAIASNPTYNLNNLNRNYKQLLDDPQQPLLDHATLANQHPGSVMKILMAVIGLHEGFITPTTRYHCPGYMMRTRSGRKILGDHATGNLNVTDAITHSSNVFFAKLGEKIGARRMVEWYTRFGIGEKYARDMPWARPQAIPSPDNIERLRPREKHWTRFDTWTLSIGQLLKISPLEAITIPACIANGGTIVRPYLVTPDTAMVNDTIALSPEHLHAIRRGMEGVTKTGGTAPLLQLGGNAAGIQVAAKTGTSEWGGKNNPYDHAWLIGYAPADNPKVAFAIFIHSGTSGGRACSGVAKKVLESYFTIYGTKGHRR